MRSMTVDEAAAWLGSSRWVISRGCVEGRIPGATRNAETRQWSIPHASLLAYLNQEVTMPANVSELPRVYTLDQVAEQTGLPLRWLQDQCRAKTIPFRRPGRTPYMTADDVNAALEYSASKNHVDPEIQAELERRAGRGRRKVA